MKAIVLTLLSCVLLGGAFGILNTRTNAAPTAAVKLPTGADTSTTLDDSHWLDDETFQKAVQEELLSNTQDAPVEEEQNGATTAPGSSKIKSSQQQETVPNVRSLILELHPDTTTRKGVPSEAV